MARQFRFGIGLRSIKSGKRLRERVREFADLGYDVVHLPDHLGAPAPFPAMMAAADAAPGIRVGTYVLNAAFYRPALLARDVVDTDLLCDGRLELGLGTGYVREEFEAAGIPYPSPAQRVSHLSDTVDHLKTVAPNVPLLIAGNGDRVLTLAAQQADIIGFSAGPSPAADPLAERIAFVRKAAGDRFEGLELNLAITAVPTDSSGIPDLTLTRAYAPGRSEAELLAMPSVLRGSPRQIADTLIARRETYGLTYFTVQDYHGRYFAEAIAALR
ncbi:MAG: TIGR03621 family F420-dependent LLM class oxidoreductase [Mycobacterium sp.]|nr:TIGR03621 family F420-dependent LLM class oxidoreductase [Mycobacterium sp.]